MIRLFRKIRHQLLSEDKYSTYILYAAGEMLLVVAGILLAFQIDNWGDLKKQQQTEMDYLIALKGEFTQNLSIAEESIRNYEDMLSAAGEILRHTGPKNTQLTEKEASILLAGSMMNATKYIPSPGILQDLINSGNLSQINNPDLRELLSEWFIILDNTSRSEDETFQHRSDLLDLQVLHTPFVNIGRDIGFSEIVRDYPDSSNFDGEIRDLFLIREFEGRMAIYAANLWGLGANSYVKISEHASKILADIENELLSQQMNIFQHLKSGTTYHPDK